MRTIGVVTTSRSDYGIYRPILRAIQADSELKLMLFVSGMHLSPRFETVKDIIADGFPILEVPIPLEVDTPKEMSQAMGEVIIRFSEVFAKSRPDLLLMLGDRFEVFAVAAASLPFNIPLAHIHGGELTYGSIDNSFRHAITKMSHLHFTAAKPYRDRLVRMGEEPWRVTLSGAPALDEIKTLPPPDASAFEKDYGLRVSPKPLLVTFHPVTLGPSDIRQRVEQQQVEELMKALGRIGMPVIFTQPNADAGGRFIHDCIVQYVKEHKDSWYVPNFGQRGYWDAMRLCAAVVGNSSSGIIEAPSLGVPVVNIGTRQDGREHPANVIDVGHGCAEIVRAIEKAIAPEFRVALEGMVNPYGDGHAAKTIVAKLKSVELGDKLLRKIFHDDGAAQ